MSGRAAEEREALARCPSCRQFMVYTREEGFFCDTCCPCGHAAHLHDPEAVPAICLACGDDERCTPADPSQPGSGQ